MKIKLNKKNKKTLLISLLIVGLMVVLLNVGTLATIVDNVTAAPGGVKGTVKVTVEQKIGDNWVPDTIFTWTIEPPTNFNNFFKAATIRGTIAFVVTITQGSVTAVGLKVEPVGAGGTPTSNNAFTKTLATVYTLNYNTNNLINGEYQFSLYATALDGTVLTFSIFGFTARTGSGTPTIDNTAGAVMLVLVLALGFGIGLIIIKKIRK